MTQKAVLFIGGPKDHGAPDRHEYLKDMNVLRYCIDHSAAGKDFKTLVFNGKIPDLKRFTNLAAIVVESSGDRIGQETHAVFPQDATTDGKTYDPYTMQQLAQLDNLMKAGTGLVAIHYTTWINNPTGRRYWADWLGGYYEDGYSKVVKDHWAVEPANSDHPVLRGIHPWNYNDEFFTKERLPEDTRRTILLTGKSDTGVSSPLAWVVERQGGGRGFMMTGSDFHQNLKNEFHLRLLLNGIAWAAKMEIPPGGMTCEVTDDVLK